jgi:serine phosphatase RsbU (regulator of sigma subunit)/tetratricopeptide (TPR) repeat protein
MYKKQNIEISSNKKELKILVIINKIEYFQENKYYKNKIMFSMKRGLFIVCSILFINSFLSQTHVGSKINSDSLIKLSKTLYHNNPSQAGLYARQAITKSIEENSKLNLGKAYEALGVSEDFLGEFDSAIYYFDISIEILKKENKKLELGKTLVSKANSLYSISKYEDALKYYTNANEIMQSLGYKPDEAASLMGIANIYSVTKFNDLSLKYYHQALKISDEVKNQKLSSYILTNIAEVYATLGNIEKEIEYETKAIKIKEELHDTYGLVYSYHNLVYSLIKQNKNQNDSILYYANKSIEMSKEIDNSDFLVSSYKCLGTAYFHLKQTHKAIENAELGLELAKKIKRPILAHVLLNDLQEMYEEIGDYKSQAKALKEYININDTINNVEIKKSFNELETKYETEKKEKEIVLLNEKDKKRSIFIYSTLTVAVLLLMLTLVLYNRYKLKQKTANELENRNIEIQKQKNLVDEKQKEILDSINYAKRIQYALLAQEKHLQTNLKDYFILFKPKDIVSGDFYWTAEHNNCFYLAVCDCTGHGVPGAFMSLLNIGFLSEAIKEKHIQNPNEIFNYVRNRLIESITNEEQKDGMDGILLCLDKTKKQITYAAANNHPLIIKKSNKLVIEELLKDKMPVGKGISNDSFNLYTINIEEGDKLFLYTDGFADQFGGPKGKKFKYKPLNNNLLSSNNLNFKEQKEDLNEIFENWKGNLEQIDDVLIIGIEV